MCVQWRLCASARNGPCCPSTSQSPPCLGLVASTPNAWLSLQWALVHHPCLVLAAGLCDWQGLCSSRPRPWLTRSPRSAVPNSQASKHRSIARCGFEQDPGISSTSLLPLFCLSSASLLPLFLPRFLPRDGDYCCIPTAVVSSTRPESKFLSILSRPAHPSALDLQCWLSPILHCEYPTPPPHYVLGWVQPAHQFSSQSQAWISDPLPPTTVSYDRRHLSTPRSAYSTSLPSSIGPVRAVVSCSVAVAASTRCLAVFARLYKKGAVGSDQTGSTSPWSRPVRLPQDSHAGSWLA
ncbi:hypothetical protein B0T26DRAFT_385250 [Lasiosphaeria miniovina]|uniref:Uncharacterized protein n=1 Tax=Lasiosphaeria miniovina TaxID=1954250 RepID=A0AA40AE18_9PEZI|nr:uncharacterized protein B0T26DRAFT_385250 [Lasiosphaeria miniovina]KAK0714120.1 hypothetical protein B0T26DRAFT_385250 [Lasiosphaeria miniovina]